VKAALARTQSKTLARFLSRTVGADYFLRGWGSPFWATAGRGVLVTGWFFLSAISLSRGVGCFFVGIVPPAGILHVKLSLANPGPIGWVAVVDVDGALVID